MPIAVFGSINIDLTTYADRLPRPGETLHGERYALGLGGKGCNQAVAARRLGAVTTLIGRIGEDEFGARARAELAAMGVPTRDIFQDPDSDTGIAVIGVDSTAQNCITVIGGANMAIDGSDVARAAERLAAADILLLQMEIPLEPALMAADLVRQSGGRVILDPAPAPANGYAPGVLARIDVITPNETETELLTGLKPTNAKEAAQAAAKLREQGVAAAVVKLGASGVYFQDAESEGFVEPFKVDSIDSVAAGDCFNGGLATALSEGRPLAEAVHFAAACGALSTTKRGASASAPTREEVEDLLARS
ncbi:ribokinase [Aliiruegeria lutimaris]|uniref:Ribokinase n=1 Tax=Aliiruegeria lutimaris TaxID=571298 RepID=A0A1G8QKZ9_9RHOB|nr:ribokinase [Aliiruegeria lutimaris]SDJ05368.1 ribokinase [Aliiruegeria lutimaris]